MQGKKGMTTPDVVIVRKSFNFYRKKAGKNRFWKLKHLKTESAPQVDGFENFDFDEDGKKGKPKKSKG